MNASTAVQAAEPLALARSSILGPAGLDDARLGRALDLVLGSAVDAADLYFQLSQEESWALEDGIVSEGSASIEQGVGVRAIAGERTGFAYSDEIVPAALEEAARAARAIAARGQAGALQAWRPVTGHKLYLPVDPMHSLTDDAKVALLGAHRPRDAQARPAHHPGDGQPACRARAGADRDQRRRARRRRAPAGAHERQRHRRARRPARAGLRRLRRALSASMSWSPANGRWNWAARRCARRW